MATKKYEQKQDDKLYQESGPKVAPSERDGASTPEHSREER